MRAHDARVNLAAVRLLQTPELPAKTPMRAQG
jgi:hypothetical protein